MKRNDRISTFFRGAISLMAAATRRSTRVIALASLGAALTASAHHVLTWEDNSTDETGFSIERSVDSGSFVEIATVGADVTSYQDTIVLGTKYSYRVRAFNEFGRSPYSAVVTNAPVFTTQPASQTVPAFSSVTFTSMATGAPEPTYQWRRNGSNIDGATSASYTIPSATSSHQGTYTVVATNGIGSPVTSTEAVLTTTKINQTITFPVLPAKGYGEPPFALTATASSDLTVTYTSSNPEVATVSGNTVTIVGVGTTNIVADQSGDGNYNAAPSFTRTLTVAKGTQTITFSALPGVTYGASSITLAATSTSGLPVTYTSSNPAVASVSGTTLTIVGAGLTTITANQAGDSRWLAASAVPQSLSVAKANQTITFVAPGPLTYGQAANLGATATSGLPVTYSSTNSSVIAVNAGGTSVTIIGGGTANVTALQSGDSNFNPAPTVTRTIQVNVAPSVTTAPANRTVNAGGATSFTVVAAGTAPLTYQWQVSTDSGGSWSDVSGATSATLSINPATTAQNGNLYRVIVTNVVTSVTSASASLNVTSVPVFTNHPANQSATTGAAVTFSAAATGNPAPAYQWQVSTNGGSTYTNLSNDATYSGVTTGTLTISNAGTSLNTFRYRAKASNSVGEANSNAAVLTVGDAIATITTNPSNQTVVAGANATFTVGAAGGPAPTIKWQVSTDGGATFTDLANDATYSGVTSSTLLITAVPHTFNGRQYRAVATNSQGSATSSAATLTVNTIAPTFTTQPADQTAPAGSPAAFTVVVDGAPTPTLQWQRSTDGGTVWTDLTNAGVYSGATSATLNLASVDGTMNGHKFRAVATNVAAPSGVSSNVVTLTVGNFAAMITSDPVNRVIPAGSTTTFSATATGSPAPTLQWQIDTGSGWSNVANDATYSGATTTTLTVANAAPTLNGADFRLTATNVGGTAASNPATLTVTTTAPSFTAHPQNRTAVVGNTATFSAAATGNPAPTYQWQYSTDGGTTWNAAANGPQFSGATTPTLTVAQLAVSMTGTQYQLVAANVAGATASSPATLTVEPAPAEIAPSIVFQPESIAVHRGTRITLSVMVSGKPEPTYQWFKDGTALPGATSPLFVKDNAQPSDAGAYTVVVTNPLGTVTSAQAEVTVYSGPLILTHPVGGTLVAGGRLTLSVVAEGSLPLTYQWRRNGVAIPGAVSSSYAIENAGSNQAGSYSVTVANEFASVTSHAALVTLDTDFAGVYFGTLSGGGHWALLVRADNTGTFIAHLPDRDSAIVTEVVINPNGTFTVADLQIAGDAATRVTAAGERRVGAATSVQLVGTIGADGKVTGQIAGADQTLSGAVDGGSGTQAALYEAAAVGAATGTTVAIVGPSGQTFLVTSDGTTVDSATGNVTDGRFETTSSEGAQVAFTLNPQTGAVSGTYRAPNGPATRFAGLSDTVASTTRIINYSTRSSTASGSDTLIAGFVVTGGASKAVLVRGVGPALAQYGVTGVLADPVLNVYRGTTSLEGNDDWNNSAEIAAAAEALLAFPFPAGSKDAAMLTALPEGVYTAHVAGKSGAEGGALVEVYDHAKGSAARLSNVSSRARVRSGQTLIAGFVLDGNAPKTLLVRGVGPSLASFGVTGALANPKLEIYDHSDKSRLRENDNWGGASALKAAFNATGAFGLADDSKDAAILITLQPGVYSAVLSGVGTDTAGVALIEIYEVP